ncbi:hypothetical protein L6R21_14305 [bacterium]|nr:hypothetical protein [bacterium]
MRARKHLAVFMFEPVESVTLGGDPDDVLRRFDHGGDGGIRQFFPLNGQLPEGIAAFIAEVQRAVPVRDPQILVAVFKKHADEIAAQALRVILLMHPVSECFRFRIKQFESAFARADPEAALAVFQNGFDLIVADAVRVVSLMEKTLKCIALMIVAIQPVARPDPQIAALILTQRRDVIVAEALRLTRAIMEHLEAIAIISIEAIEGAKPHESLAVLQNTNHIGLGQAVVRGEMGEAKIVVLGVGGSRAESKTRKNGCAIGSLQNHKRSVDDSMPARFASVLL